MATILAALLKANLLQIGDDDSKYVLLEEASQELAKKIAESPLLAYRLMLVALDERVPSSDAAHQLVGDIVSEKWKTMTNKAGVNASQIYRAVMLTAVELAAEKDDAIRFAIPLIAHNEVPRGNKDGTHAIVSAVLDKFEETSRNELVTAWANPIEMADLKVGSKVKRAQLKEELAAGINPDTVAAAVQSAAKTCAEDMQEALKGIVENWTVELKKLAIRDAKAELLWIRASHYSPSARSSLRQLSPIDLVLHTVLDVSRAVPAMAPPSVEYFLRELISSLTVDRIKLDQLLVGIGPKLAKEPEGTWVCELNNPLPVGKISWLERAVRGSGATSFELATGVSTDFDGTFSEFGVRFYRELQIRKLLS